MFPTFRVSGMIFSPRPNKGWGDRHLCLKHPLFSAREGGCCFFLQAQDRPDNDCAVSRGPLFPKECCSPPFLIFVARPLSPVFPPGGLLLKCPLGYHQCNPVCRPKILANPWTPSGRRRNLANPWLKVPEHLAVASCPLTPSDYRAARAVCRRRNVLTSGGGFDL